MAAEPIPVGTLVDYHGSIESYRGRYTVDAHGLVPKPGEHPLHSSVTGEMIAEAYPDGVTYSLWPEGFKKKFGLRHLVVSRVRRASVTPVGDREVA